MITFQPITINDKYQLMNKIGSGSFGQIFMCKDNEGNKYAAKFEDNRTKYPQLKFESQLYNLFSGCVNTAKLHWFGSQSTNDVMVIDLLGKSLQSHLSTLHKLSLKSTLMVADQMISSIEYLHKRSFIHRDIKLDNFVMGIGKKAGQVYIIDFGLAKRYRDLKTHKHIKMVKGKNLTGTARYASINALKGYEQSRRDDMESLGYVFIYLLKGSLPWIGLSGDKLKSKFEMICDYKETIPLSRLCEGIPEEFAMYLDEVRNLEFTEEPDYAKYRQMFRNLFIKKGYVYDNQFDWTNKVTVYRRERRSTERRIPVFSELKKYNPNTGQNPNCSGANFSISKTLLSSKANPQMSTKELLNESSFRPDFSSTSDSSTDSTDSSSSDLKHTEPFPKWRASDHHAQNYSPVPRPVVIPIRGKKSGRSTP